MLIQIFSPSSIGGKGFLSGLYQFSIATSTSNGVGLGYSIANAGIYLILIVSKKSIPYLIHLSYKFSLSFLIVMVADGFTPEITRDAL